MENKFNWKEALKETTKGFGKEMFDVLCIMITAGIVLLTQTDQQLKTISTLFDDRNWIILSLILMGIVIFSFLVQKILKGIYWIIATPLKFAFRSLKYRLKNNV